MTVTCCAITFYYYLYFKVNSIRLLYECISEYAIFPITTIDQTQKQT